MIQIENISKNFGKLRVLDNVSLALERNKCIALIGPNASGKTTLIKTILGLVIADEGSIYVKGTLIKNDCLYRRDIGYMPQIGRYPDNMTIGQLFKMITDVRKTSWEKCDIELMSKFEIKRIEDKRLGTLSGGTRQKVSACLAFLFNPDILILDEPTAGLDPVSTEILKEKINIEKGKGKLIIITSHVLSDLDELVDEIIFLQEGKINFRKNVELLRFETGEAKLSKAIAKVMGYQHG
jgi:Cu-processing system ATP-binding protein